MDRKPGRYIRSTWRKNLGCQVQYDPPLDLSLVHQLEDVIDVFQLVCLHRCLDFSGTCKFQGFRQVGPGSNNGPANGNPIQNDVEDTEGEGSWR